MIFCRNDGPLDVRWYVLFNFLLAHWRPLDLQYQLFTLVKCRAFFYSRISINWIHLQNFIFVFSLTIFMNFAFFSVSNLLSFFFLCNPALSVAGTHILFSYFRGEKKIWYGVPGSEGEKFDRAVQNLVPDLFKKHPDLLHHMTTMINPMILMEHVSFVIYIFTCCAIIFVILTLRSFKAFCLS